MAANPLELLSQSALKALPFIRQGVARGLSSTRIQSALQASALGVRRIELLRAIRVVKGIEDTGPSLRSIPKSFAPDISRLPEPATRTLRALSFRVELRGFNITTGLNESRFVTLSLDNVLSVREMEDIALGIAGNVDAYGTVFEVESSIISSGTFNRIGGLL